VVELGELRGEEAAEVGALLDVGELVGAVAYALAAPEPVNMNETRYC